MEQGLDLHLEDFVSSEILNVLQDTKNDSAPLDKQSLAATFNLGPSKETSERFGTISKEEIHNAIEKRVPANTKKSTGRVYKVWLEWCKVRNINENILTMDETKVNEFDGTLCAGSQTKRWKIIYSVFTQLRCFSCPTLLAGEWTPCFMFLRREK